MTVIFGGRGFIGSHLARALPEANVFQGRMDNLDEMRAAVRGARTIYHLAGKNRVKAEGDIIKNNVLATSNIVRACKIESAGQRVKVVFLSSTQVKTRPISDYGFAKAIEEKILMDNFETAIIRAPGIFGPGCRPFYNSVVATFCHQVARGNSPTIHGGGDEKIELMYIDHIIYHLLNPIYNTTHTYGKHSGGFESSIAGLARVILSKPTMGNIGETLEWHRRQYEISGT